MKITSVNDIVMIDHRGIHMKKPDFVGAQTACASSLYNLNMLANLVSGTYWFESDLRTTHKTLKTRPPEKCVTEN